MVRMLVPVTGRLRTVVVAAAGLNNEIGQSGGMPWHVTEDLQHFRRETVNGCVIMGRRTFESIGRPLPGRRNIVITSDAALRDDARIETAASLEEALRLAHDAPAAEAAFLRAAAADGSKKNDADSGDARREFYDKVCLIGGSRVFAAAMELADSLIITRLNSAFPDADVFLSEIPESFALESVEPARGRYVTSSTQPENIRQIFGERADLRLDEMTGGKSERDANMEYRYERYERR